jgi:hypothetical protein
MASSLPDDYMHETPALAATFGTREVANATTLAAPVLDISGSA